MLTAHDELKHLVDTLSADEAELALDALHQHCPALFAGDEGWQAEAAGYASATTQARLQREAEARRAAEIVDVPDDDEIPF